MKTISLELPEVAFSTMRMDRAELATEMRNAALVKWYELGKISQGRAAEILGLSRRAFIDLLGRYQVSPFQYTPDELMHELG
jgi:predicted HTH domain antitoxin